MIGKLLNEAGSLLFFVIALSLLVTTANGATKLEKEIREDVTKNQVSTIYNKSNLYKENDLYETKLIKTYNADGDNRLVTVAKLSRAQAAAEIYKGLTSGVTYYVGIKWVNPENVHSMKDVYDMCSQSSYNRYTQSKLLPDGSYTLVCYYK